MKISISFIKSLKQQIIASRYAVAKIANAEMLRLYFCIGRTIDNEFDKNKWGAKVIDDISKRLQQELPGLRGFSSDSIKKMRRFYKEWKSSDLIWSSLTTKIEKSENEIWSSLTTKIEKIAESSDTKGLAYQEINIKEFLSVSFTHHYEIILKTEHEFERWYYIKKTANHFWPVRHLRTELINQSHKQEENLPNNFEKTIPDILANKALRAFKDQYLLDFVNVEDSDENIDEKVLEHEIVNNIKKFLLSLGTDFSFMGNQFRLVIDGDEYFIDLLFFHRGLQSLIAFELKKGKFKPEYVGKMNFYLSALDDTIKQPHENPSIGIILCKEKADKKVEYSIKDLNKPMGVSVYKTSDTLPPELKNSLPDSETLKKLMEY